MAITAYKMAGTGVSDASFGTTAWSNPGNITANDTSYANKAESAVDSQYLKGTNFGFTPADIPSGSTIDGIEMRYRRAEVNSEANVVTTRLRAVKGGAIHTANVSTMNAVEWGTDIDAAGALITEGGAADLWGLAWTDSDVRASDFGFALSCIGTSGTGDRSCDVDYFECRIHYTAPPPSGFPFTVPSFNHMLLR